MIYNTLFINRIVIFTERGELAYDEQFHKGVNIIRGRNSSGKSTIANFIFYVLGGDFTHFVPEAQQCSEVFAETEMNGAKITIRRPIERDENRKIKSRTPMYFYWGNYEEARNPPPGTNWQKFGYNSYFGIKSFSNVIFDNLDIPVVKGDSNITIHQLLRLMFIDQDSPTSSLYYYEQFDSQLTRETTAELLLGIYDDTLYQARRRHLEVGREIEELKVQIKATKGIVQNPLMLVPANVEAQIENLQNEANDVDEEITILKQSDVSKRVKLDDFRFQQLNEAIIKQRSRVVSLETKLEETINEIADNEFFITSLSDKIKALKNSLTTRELLNNLPLHFCPDCLTEITNSEQNQQNNKCKLCKETIDSTLGKTQGRRMEQEIGFQITESTTIQKNLTQEKDSLIPLLKKEVAILKDLQKKFDLEVKGIKSSNEERIENLFIQKGQIEGQILQFRTILEQALYYIKLIESHDTLVNERRVLEDYIRKTEQQQNALRDKIDTQLRKEALYLLNNDLHRQDEFKSANDFHIDFSNNIAFLSNKYSKYSASSNFYLKITARFAVFLASLSIPEMRYPRFILADNMEDKGIEKERAQNFQKILISRLKDFDPEKYQVIYTTSYITEELNNSNLVVGDFYTEANRSLKNVDRWAPPSNQA